MFVRLVLIAMLAISAPVLLSNPLQSKTETEQPQSKTETEQRWWEKREERKPDIYFPHNIHIEALEKEGDVCALCHSFQKTGETDLELIKELTVVINEPLKAMCHDCHVVEQRAPWRCSICHTDKTTIWPDDHNFNYVQHHGSVARKNEEECRECHIEMSFCSDCHFRRETSGVGYHPLGYITLHGMEARAMPGNCGRCHNNRYCENCHERRQ